MLLKHSLRVSATAVSANHFEKLPLTIYLCYEYENSSVTDTTVQGNIEQVLIIPAYKYPHGEAIFSFDLRIWAWPRLHSDFKNSFVEQIILHGKFTNPLQITRRNFRRRCSSRVSQYTAIGLKAVLVLRSLPSRQKDTCFNTWCVCEASETAPTMTINTKC